MSEIIENPEWHPSVDQIDTSDKVLGGPDGVINQVTKQLADRTAFLKQEVESVGEQATSAIEKADNALGQIDAIELANGSAVEAAQQANQHRADAQAAAALAIQAKNNAGEDATQAYSNARAAIDAAGNAQMMASQASTSATVAQGAANLAVGAKDATLAARDRAIEAENSASDDAGVVAAMKTEIRNWYYGPLEADPVTRPDGTPVEVGDEYHDSALHVRKVFSNGAWQDVSTAALAMPGGAALVGQGVMAVDSIADLLALPAGQRKEGLRYLVKGYHAGSDVGGGEFYWDASSTAVGNDGTVIAVPGLETGRFIRLLANNCTDTRQWGMPGSLSPQDLARRMQTMWDWCAAQRVKAILCPDTFVLDRYTGRPDPSSALLLPANLNVHFELGCKITKVPFVEETIQTFYRIISVLSTSTDIIGTGTLEIDGQGDTVTWYNEHNHCIFFYACRDVDFSSLEIVAYNAMGDCVSLSGQNNVGGLTKRVRIGAITCLKLNSIGKTARRKSLVIEACSDCWIGSAVLDNGATNCLDYEPFNLVDDGDVMSLKIDYLKCFSGTDYTAGVPAGRQRVAKLYIDTFVITLPDREAALNKKGPLILSYGVDCVVNSLSIDYQNSVSDSCNAMSLQYTGCRWSVNDLHIFVSDYVQGPSAISVVAISSTSGEGAAELNVGNLRLKGRGNKSISARGIITGNNFIFEGVLAEDGTKDDLGGTTIYGQWNQHLSHYFSVDSVLFKNVRGLDNALISPVGYQDNYPMLWKIGQVTVIDESSNEPINAVVRCSPRLFQEHVHIGGIALKGQKPMSLTVVATAGNPFWVTSGGFGYPSEYFRQGVNPNGIGALAGSTCRCTNGTFWVKTVDDDGAGDRTFGWQQLTTENV